MRTPSLVACLVCSSLAVSAAAEPVATTDLDRLQGTWILISTLTDGTPVDFDHPGDTTLSLKGERYQLSNEAAITTAPAGKVKLDETQKPRHIDAISSAGPNQGLVSLGIYEIVGDRFRVMLAPPGDERPESFSTDLEDGCTLQIWERLDREPIPQPAI